MLANWIKATTTTTGTGTLTLSSVSGFPAVGDWFADGDLLAYVITDSNDKPVESGVGTYTASGTTLARTLVQGTYVSGSLVKSGGAITAATLSGTNNVYVSAIAGTSLPGYKSVIPLGASGQLVPAFSPGSTMTGGAVSAANRMYITEFIHGSPRQIKGFRTYCGSTSGNIMFGLYRINMSGGLEKLVASTGSKVVASGLASYALASPIWLPPDRYACAVIVDNITASFRTISAVTTASIFGADSTGYGQAAAYAAPGSFTMADPYSAGSLMSGTGGGNGGPAVYVEYN